MSRLWSFESVGERVNASHPQNRYAAPMSKIKVVYPAACSTKAHPTSRLHQTTPFPTTPPPFQPQVPRTPLPSSLIRPIKRLQRPLGIGKMLLGIQKILPTPIQALLLVRLGPVAGLVLHGAEVLDLLAGVAHFVQAEGGARALQEVPFF